jgi:hypothetical protein
VAFDPLKGCLWAVCPSCARWNLAPIEERWEVVDECERRFRATALRYSSGNIGLAWLGDDVELIRVGKALRPEVASWRYGRVLVHKRPLGRRSLETAAGGVLRLVRTLTASARGSMRDPRAITAQLLLTLYGNKVLDLVHLPGAIATDGQDIGVAVVRYRHVLGAALARPEPGRAWSLRIPHDHGLLTIEGNEGVGAAARALAVINGTARGGGFSRELLETAVRKVDESAQSDSYFNRVLALALHSSWGREVQDDAPRREMKAMEVAQSDVERLAFRLTGRTFWSHGGIGSEPSTMLLDVPLVDRLALEIAAHEESERRLLDGELGELEAAWREADEIASIADALLLD